jgi:sulfite exporter TauE/SafE
VGSAFQLTINHFWIAIIGGLVIITLNLPWNKWGLSIDMPWIQTLSKTVKKWTKHQSLQQRFFLGMLNGILPCGMVYIALAVAFSLHNPFSGAFFMLLFGISTSPALLFIQQIKAWISKIPFFQKEKTVRYSLMVLGLLIIMRGAGLGIPYLSPKNIASPAGNNKPACCHTN